jgi:hypothetical protein
MAFTSKCTTCGTIALTVWAADERRCLECVERIEFVPGAGRRLRGFLCWRVLRDDRFEDRRSSPAAVEDVSQLVLDDVIPPVDVGGVEPGRQLLAESPRVERSGGYLNSVAAARRGHDPSRVRAVEIPINVGAARVPSAELVRAVEHR